MDTATFERLGLNQKLPGDVVVNGKSGLDIRTSQLSHPGDAAYHPCDEAYPDPDVPRGNVIRIDGWAETAVFPQTTRDIAIYVPAQLAESRSEPNVLICNDGAWYSDLGFSVRAPLVLDSLIHAGRIPPTVGIFIQPGDVTTTDAAFLAAMDHPASDQRSYEYDRITADYPRMLAEEVLPLAAATVHRELSSDPERTIVCGVSSGGIAAFNAAWHMPERFGRVISHCGSFANIRGGHNYPYLVRSTPRKAIKVWMQSGEHDADAPWGNWPLANKTMANALEYAGYDVHFEFGTGAHNLRHGGALFAAALKWHWDLKARG